MPILVLDVSWTALANKSKKRVLMSDPRVFVRCSLALGKNAVCPDEKSSLKLYYVYLYK